MMWVQTGSSGNCRIIYSFPSHPQQNPAEASSTQCWSQPAPCPQLRGVSVGDHQSIQSPIQHHPAQLSAQTQLSSSALVPGSNLPPPADVPCAACDHPCSVLTQEPQRPWLPFRALAITTDHQRRNLCLGSHRELVTPIPVALGALRTEPSCPCPIPLHLVHSPTMADSQPLCALL